MDWPGYTAVIAGIMALFTMGGFIWRLSSRVTSSENLGIAVAANNLEIKRLESDFNDHRVAIAEKYVSKDALRETKIEILSAIRDLSDRINRLRTEQT